MSDETSAAPLVPLVRRLELIPISGGDGVNNDEDDYDIHPTECFLQYLDYPEDDTSCIDLQQAAVVIISHLDRLARPLCPRDISKNVVKQNIRSWGGDDCDNSSQLLKNLGVTSVTWCNRVIVFISSDNSVNTVINGDVSPVDTSQISDRDSVPVYVTATHSHIVILTSTGEIWVKGAGQGHALQLVTSLIGRRVVQVAAGQNHCAVVTDMGHVYTWADDKIVPAPVSALSGHSVIHVACGQGGDHCNLALTDSGFVYTWHGAGQTGAIPKLVDTMTGLDVSQLAAGANFSAAVTRAGDVYVWGQVGLRDEYILTPRHVPGVTAVHLVAGPCFLVALDANGSVWGWGDNDHQQLGSQLAAHVTSPTLVTAPSDKSYIGVSCCQQQVVAWSSESMSSLPSSSPFVIDVCESTFRQSWQLDQI